MKIVLSVCGPKKIGMNFMEPEKQNQTYHWILGIYIFQERLNTCLVHIREGGRCCHAFNPGTLGLRDLKAWTRQQGNELGKDTLSCIGHTGLNTREVVQYLLSQEVEVWLESLEQIRRGNGKSDKINAERIADYALHHQGLAQVVDFTGSSLEKLKDLQGNRTRLMQAIQNLQGSTQELKKIDIESGTIMERVNRDALRGLEKSLEQVEVKISLYIGSMKLSLRKRV